MAYRTRYRAKIKARKRTSKQTGAKAEPYTEIAKEDIELHHELGKEGKESLKKTQDDLEENLPHAKHEYMDQLKLQPVIARREPDDKFFITKIHLMRNKGQDVIPRCTCLCYCGTDLALWKAKRRQMGITHAKVLLTNTE